MSREEESLSRRSFLKGAAAAGVVALVPGSGLFVKELGAQVSTKMGKRRGIKEPPGVKVDKDVIPLAASLAKASFEGAYDAFNAAAEKLVKGKARKVNTGDLLRAQGLRLISGEAKSAAKSFTVPQSILKVREMQLRQMSHHTHCPVTFVTVCGTCTFHSHVVW